MEQHKHRKTFRQSPLYLVRHPRGAFLIDASLGSGTAADLEASPWWFRWNFKSAAQAAPLAQLVRSAGIDPASVTRVLVTHAHWDHTGGLAELPNARVSMSAAEADWILGRSGPPPAIAMAQHVVAVRDRIDRLDFAGPSFGGFPASQDVFGDGTVIAVPSPGHTPGATSYFVRSGSDRTWLFVGDAAWVKEGFEEPATKGRLASLLADWDRARTAESLGIIHAVHRSGAAWVVTSHDARTWMEIRRCDGASSAR